jgi:hypothetical protein
VKQLGSFSLQRSEMFIATSRRPKILAPLGAKPGSGTFAEAGKSDCAPAQLPSKERIGSYKHLAPQHPMSDEATSNVLSVFLRTRVREQ